MYENHPKKDRPIIFLQAHPGWHNIRDIAVSCSMTPIETGAALRGTNAQRKRTSARFPLQGIGICAPSYPTSDIRYRITE